MMADDTKKIDFGSAATHVAQALAARDYAKRQAKRLKAENAELLAEIASLTAKYDTAAKTILSMNARMTALKRRLRARGAATPEQIEYERRWAENGREAELQALSRAAAILSNAAETEAGRPADKSLLPQAAAALMQQLALVVHCEHLTHVVIEAIEQSNIMESESE